MVKCAKCVKIINKKTPGLQCNKCSKWIHGSCANLTPEQLSILFATEAADWRCRACLGNTKPKRLSFIMPDAEEDADTDGEQQHSSSTTNKMISDIRREVREVVRIELQSVLQFYSDKIDDYEIKVKQYETQCNDLKNTCKNLILRNDALEQKVQNIEQNSLKNYIEIDGIPEKKDENMQLIMEKICSTIKQKKDDILKVYRKKSTNAKKNTNKPYPIVALLCEGRRDSWIAAAREAKLTVKDLDTEGESKIYEGESKIHEGESKIYEGDSKIYVRESLTAYTSALLWQAKTALKNTNICKYVWCKDGSVKARKTDKTRIFVLRSISDIERLASELKQSEINGNESGEN